MFFNVLTSTVCTGDHSGSGSGAGRWGAEAGQLFVHARRTQSPWEAAERRQRRVAQVTPPILSPRPLMEAKPSQQYQWTVSVSLCLICIFVVLISIITARKQTPSCYLFYFNVYHCMFNSFSFCLCFTFLPCPLIFYKFYFETLTVTLLLITEI